MRWRLVGPSQEREDTKVVDMAGFDPRQMSRKNHALLAALDDFEERRDIDAVCVLDSDVFCDPVVLDQRLPLYFEHSEVGVVCGMRRYILADNLPAAIRLCWQHFAAQVMRDGKIAWGGCMAFRWALVPDFCAAWEKSLFDDSPAFRIARRRGFTFIHSGLITLDDSNDATMTWGELWNFIIRQLLSARFSHAWFLVWISWALLLNVTYLAWTQLPPVAIVCLYAGVALGLARGWRMLPAVALCQLLHLASVPMAQVTRAISWAGLTYRIKDFK